MCSKNKTTCGECPLGYGTEVDVEAPSSDAAMEAA